MSSLKNDLCRKEIAKYKRQKASGAVADAPTLSNKPPVFDMDDYQSLYSAGLLQEAPQSSYFDGNKFFGGFGPTQLYIADYWELRAKSAQLFRDNLYARGIVRRLVTNEINTGLSPESIPDESVLGVPEDSLSDWSEDIENRFNLWAKNPTVCDFKGEDNFSELQQSAKMEAYITGDILVTVRINKKTNMPYVQLTNGSRVMSPGRSEVAKTHSVRHGVELDRNGRQVAYWIRQDGGKFKRLPKFGSRGRVVSFLLYGTDKRMDEVRGEPLLSIILQSLKEIDRYRDSVQRKATINSMVALQVVKTQDKVGTKPISGGAIRKGSATVTDSDGSQREFNIAKLVPGTAVDEMQQGEEIKGFNSDGIDLDFGKFEQAIIHAVAWALEIPPEILILSFNSNYSASQAAINEFKMYLNMKRTGMGSKFCGPIFVEWMISETLNRKINAPGLLKAWRDPNQYEIFGAWIAADWSGAIKPSSDIVKTAKGYKIMVDENFITRTRATREVSGMKYSKVAKQNTKDNQALADSMRPLMELQQELSAVPGSEAAVNAIMTKMEGMIEAKLDDSTEDIVENVIETLAQNA